jgi:hypothetical protein
VAREQALAAMPAASAIAADDAGVASSRMSYSRFLVRPLAVRPCHGRFAKYCTRPSTVATMHAVPPPCHAIAIQSGPSAVHMVQNNN